MQPNKHVGLLPLLLQKAPRAYALGRIGPELTLWWLERGVGFWLRRRRRRRLTLRIVAAVWAGISPASCARRRRWRRRDLGAMPVPIQQLRRRSDEDCLCNAS
ncbi:hypothetical protein TIFTF001_030539 [Ficus carica]|uniref:Uncharacterized protein n=1 Tax=Ficus carica TaxID=3494 RepID=A0AA88DU06_FICCA|nr:hypothetical protein TIFTF001_030539 [Ficus carica]